MKLLVVPCGNQISLLNQQLLSKGLPQELLGVIKDTFINLLMTMADSYLESLIGNLDLSEFHMSEYIDSFHIFVQNDNIGIGFHGQSWVIEAMENGHSGYDIKAALLNSPKARISKSGERYRNIPMKKDITSHPALKTGLGREVSIDIIREVVEKRFKGLIKTQPTSLKETKLLESKKYDYQSDYFRLAPDDRTEKETKIERVRTFKKSESLATDESFVNWVTVSESSMSSWDHPGFIAMNVAEHLCQYLLTTADTIKREIESIITERL